MAAEIIGSGNVPQRSDTRRLLLVKDTLASSAGGGGGGGVTHGNPAPSGVPAGNNGVYIQGTGPACHFWVWDGANWQQLI